MDDAALNNIFTSLGFTIQRSKIIPDSRGTGFAAAMVQVGSVEEATAAITSMDGTGSDEFLQLAASLCGASGGGAALAEPEAAQPPVHLGAAPHQQSVGLGMLKVDYAGSGRLPSDNLYLTGLPSPQVDQSALEQLFATMGVTVRRSKVIPDSNGSGSSAAMIQLGSQEEAGAAIEALNGQPLTELGLAAHALHGEALPPAALAPAAVAGQAIPGVLSVTFKNGGKGKGEGKAADSSDSLYITGLPSPQVAEETIRQVFATMGLEVQWCRAYADTTGRGSSAAMVQLGSNNDARAALAALDGLDCASAGFDAPAAAVAVEPATPCPAPAEAAAAPAAGGGTLSVRYAGSQQTPSDNLYITGLPSPVVDEGDLNQLFAGLGYTILRTKTIPDTRGQGHSAAMVQLATAEEAGYAIESLNGIKLG